MDKMEQRLVSMQEQIEKVVKKIKGTVRPFVEQKIITLFLLYTEHTVWGPQK